MSKPNDGGPAFPSTGNSVGMSIRDYFAGQIALGDAMVPSSEWPYNTDSRLIELKTKLYFQIADAMINEKIKFENQSKGEQK